MNIRATFFLAIFLAQAIYAQYSSTHHVYIQEQPLPPNYAEGTSEVLKWVAEQQQQERRFQEQNQLQREALQLDRERQDKQFQIELERLQIEQERLRIETRERRMSNAAESAEYSQGGQEELNSRPKEESVRGVNKNAGHQVPPSLELREDSRDTKFYDQWVELTNSINTCLAINSSNKRSDCLSRVAAITCDLITRSGPNSNQLRQIARYYYCMSRLLGVGGIQAKYDYASAKTVSYYYVEPSVIHYAGLYFTIVYNLEANDTFRNEWFGLNANDFTVTDYKVKIISENANKGDPICMYYMALANLYEGKTNLFFINLEKAANAGVPEAQRSLGRLYSDGVCVPENMLLSLYWSVRATLQTPDADWPLNMLDVYYKSVANQYHAYKGMIDTASNEQIAENVLLSDYKSRSDKNYGILKDAEESLIDRYVLASHKKRGAETELDAEMALGNIAWLEKALSSSALARAKAKAENYIPALEIDIKQMLDNIDRNIQVDQW